MKNQEAHFGEPVALPPAQYDDLNDAPHHLRQLDGARLDLTQINFLNLWAVELGGWRNNGFGNVHEPDEGAARDKFRTLYHVVENQWLEGAPEEVL